MSHATEPEAPRLRCRVFRGLPKELEEDVNKFLETTPCVIRHMAQSEAQGHVSLTILYEPVAPSRPRGQAPAERAGP